MPFYGLKGFIADHVFYPAGIFRRTLGVYAQGCKYLSQDAVPFIYLFRDRTPLLCEGDITVVSDHYVSF